MRSVSLVERLEFEFKGSLFQNAVCICDVDGDQENELCVCNTAGELAVFKGANTKPWRLTRELGCVVVLCHGPIRCRHEKLLCAINTDGWCSLFTAVPNDEDDDATTGHDAAGHVEHDTDVKPLRLVYRQKLAPNAKVALIEDVDNDGSFELIIGYTDRNVRIYKWRYGKDGLLTSPTSTNSRSSLNKMGGAAREWPTAATDSMTDTITTDERKSTLSFHLQFSKESTCSAQRDPYGDSRDDATSKDRRRSDDTAGIAFTFDQEAVSRCSDTGLMGSFELVRTFLLLEQLGSIAVCHTADVTRQLLASQPDGGYCVLATFSRGGSIVSELDTPVTPHIDSPGHGWKQDSFPTFHPMPSPKSLAVNTEILGGIKRNHEVSGVIALCTYNGVYMILEASASTERGKKKSDHRWFAVDKFDVTQDGNDEVVLCSMDGMTYIIDKENQVLSYNFKDDVSAFRAGVYHVEGKSNPCLCYVTLSGKIVLYHKVHVESMRVQCVHGALIERLRERPEYAGILDALRLPSGDIDHLKIQKLVTHVWSGKSKSPPTLPR